jgi:hypothetical protein
LLSGTIDVAAFVIQIAEAFDESLLRFAARERMNVSAAKIAIAIEQPEDFEVAFGQLDALLGRSARHA